MQPCVTGIPTALGLLVPWDQIRAVARGQAHCVCPERIVGARGHARGQRVAIGGVLFADRFRWIPGRILLLADHMRQPERRAPIHLADAHRVSDDRLRLAALGLGIVIKPMLRQIHDDALVVVGEVAGEASVAACPSGLRGAFAGPQQLPCFLQLITVLALRFFNFSSLWAAIDAPGHGCSDGSDNAVWCLLAEPLATATACKERSMLAHHSGPCAGRRP